MRKKKINIDPRDSVIDELKSRIATLELKVSILEAVKVIPYSVPQYPYYPFDPGVIIVGPTAEPPISVITWSSGLQS